MTAVLKAENRETKKSVLTKLRKEGFIPAVLYGDDIENQTIAVEERVFSKVYRDVGRSGVITLEIGNESHPVMVYDLQIDPIKNNVVHADFLKVDMNVEVDAEIPVQLNGQAPGEKEGGVLQQSLHTLNVRALPAKLPSSIEVSLEELNIGDSIAVSDLKDGADYEILNDDEEVIVSVLAPSSEEPETTEVEGEDAAEPADAEGEDSSED